MLKQHEAWQGPALPEKVWLAPARVHRKDVVPVQELAVFLLILALVLTAVLVHSLCVMAKDEDEAEQAAWLREWNKKEEDGKGK